MKTIFTTAVIALALASSPAMANGKGNNGNNGNRSTNTNLNNLGQSQGQSQGQAQGQAQGQLQGQGQSQNASNRNNVSNSNSYKSEGSVSASVGAAACSNGFSLGVPGVAAIGSSWSDKDCKKMMAAQMLLDAGAITKQDFARIVFSTSALAGFTYGAPKAATTTSAMQRPAHVKAHYAKCETLPTGRLQVTMARGGDRATAIAQCKVAMK